MRGMPEGRIDPQKPPPSDHDRRQFIPQTEYVHVQPSKSSTAHHILAFPSFALCSSGATQFAPVLFVSGLNIFCGMINSTERAVSSDSSAVCRRPTIALLAIHTPKVGGSSPSSTGTRGSLNVGSSSAIFADSSLSGNSGTSSSGRDYRPRQCEQKTITPPQTHEINQTPPRLPLLPQFLWRRHNPMPRAAQVPRGKRL